MPRAPRRPCAVKSCPELTDKRYCEEHEKEHWKRLHKQDNRASASHRGYDAKWSRLARMYGAEHPLCEDCLLAGKTVAKDLVDHVKPIATHPHLRLVWDNLRSLCKPCHERKHGYD